MSDNRWNTFANNSMFGGGGAATQPGYDWTGAATKGMGFNLDFGQQGGSGGLLGGNNFNTEGAGGFMGDLAEGLGAFNNLADTWMGYQQYRLAKDQMRFNEDVTRTNLANQAKTVNQRISDRNNARLAFSPSQYQPTAQVMEQFGVSGEVGGG